MGAGNGTLPSLPQLLSGPLCDFDFLTMQSVSVCDKEKLWAFMCHRAGMRVRGQLSRVVLFFHRGFWGPTLGHQALVWQVLLPTAPLHRPCYLQNETHR